MAAVKELLAAEENGALRFGDYELAEKKKRSDFEVGGDVYKVKTFSGITRLECNETVLYESVPGTAVTHFLANGSEIAFTVEGPEDAQITLGAAENTAYEVLLDGVNVGAIRTNLSGKLAFSVELSGGQRRAVRVLRQATN